jgi:hypothetical protein
MTTSTRALASILLIVVVAAIASLVARGVNRSETTSGGSVDTAAGEVRSATAPRRIAGGSYEASGLAAVPGDSQFLFVDDGQERAIFLLTLGNDGSQAGDAVAVPLPADVTDMEGVTTDGHLFYVVGSQSKNSGFEGDGLVRFTFDPRTRRIDSVETIRGLKAWLAASVAELRGTERLTGDEVLNIEGLAWDPARGRLLLGLRAPVVADSALLVAVRLVDTARAFSADNLTVDGPTLRLALGGAGIRGIEWDPVANAFVVITGASLDEENRDFRLLEWDGRSGTALREIATYDRRLKPEGIAGAAFGGRPARVVVFDVGQVAVMPD